MDHDRYLPLAPRDLLVLAVLAEGPLHGYGIIKAVEVRSESGVFLDPANLYRVLRRMKGEGWIREAGSHTQSGTVSGADKRRKTYEISRTGRSLLAAELTRLERLLKYTRPTLADGKGG